MKKHSIRWLAGALCVLSAAGMSADTGTPCLVFTGAAQDELVLALKDYSRITFGRDAMRVMNPSDSGNSVELPYSDYCRLTFEARDLSALGESALGEDASFVYDKELLTLSFISRNGDGCKAAIFSVKGVMVCHTTMRSGDSVSLEALAPGVYIAVASDGDRIYKIKFVK